MTLSTTSPGDERLPHADSVQQPSDEELQAVIEQHWGYGRDNFLAVARALLARFGTRPAAEPGAPGSTDAERAAWLADKIMGNDYIAEAAQMLRRWPAAEPIQSSSAGEAVIERAIDWIRNNYQEHNIASLCDGLRAHLNGVAK